MRRVTYLRFVIGLGALCVGLVACTPSGRPAGPVAFVAPSTTDPVLLGQQPVRGSSGDLVLFLPFGGKHQIRIVGDDAICWEAAKSTVADAPCDANKASQLFVITVHEDAYAAGDLMTFSKVAN
jgi:hypothetical protein